MCIRDRANYLGVTLQADIIKQKLPENNGGFEALNRGGSSYGKFDPRIYTELASDHPIDLTRYQIANCYMGRAGLINSGGESKGVGDLAAAVTTAVAVSYTHLDVYKRQPPTRRCLTRRRNCPRRKTKSSRSWCRVVISVCSWDRAL